MYQNKGPGGESPISIIGAGIAGAYRAANGDHNRAVHYFASGYYEAAKRQRLQQVAESRHGRSGRLQAPLDITPKQVADGPAGQ